MSESACTFHFDFEAFARKLRLRYILVIKRILFELFREFQRVSPVDTGMFRANWQISIGSRPEGTNTWGGGGVRDDQGRYIVGGGGQARAREEAMAVLARISPNDKVFYISNNLPYAMRLEFGYSKKAPEGVVRLSVEGWVEKVNRILAEVDNEVN